MVLDGVSEIDESLVTGETARRAVTVGTTVYAGSINFSGALMLRVTAAGSDTLVDEVERLLQQAISNKSRTVRLADRAARLYAPGLFTCRGADGARLAYRRRFISRFSRRRDHGVNYYLPLCPGTRNSCRAGRRCRTIVPLICHSQQR